MRDYKHINSYYNELLGDIYEQPQDPGHTAWAKHVIFKWVSMLKPCNTVLDVGCGEAFCQPLFEEIGVQYLGVTLGKDYTVAKEQGRNVDQEDFHFLPYADNSFSLIFSRHSLEHSPMPLFALMEWHRVATNWLCVVLPKPSYWLWGGRNHYSILELEQARFLINRSGWHIIWEDHIEDEEYRFMAEKGERILTFKEEKKEEVQNEN